MWWFGKAQTASEMPNSISNVDRDRLISCHERNDDYVAFASSMGINRRTAYGILRTFMRTGRRHQLVRGGSTRAIFSEAMLEALIEFVEEKPTATLNEMRLRLLELFPSSPVSISTISRHLDGSLITLKLLRSVPFAWNTPEVKEERYAFAQWMIQRGIHSKWIFLDECGYNLWTSRTQGRSQRGTLAVRTVCGQRGQNLTIRLSGPRSCPSHPCDWRHDKGEVRWIFGWAFSAAAWRGRLDHPVWQRSTTSWSSNAATRWASPNGSAEILSLPQHNGECHFGIEKCGEALSNGPFRSTGVEQSHCSFGAWQQSSSTPSSGFIFHLGGWVVGFNSIEVPILVWTLHLLPHSLHREAGHFCLIMHFFWNINFVEKYNSLLFWMNVYL